MNNITIKKATQEDAPFIAWTVLTALDMNTENLNKTIESCRDSKSLYSWKNSIIAYNNQHPIGCIISYPGDNYKEMRDYTWHQLWGKEHCDKIENVALETKKGEYYIDSFAILPEYRGGKIGLLLLKAAIHQGQKLGYTKFALIADNLKDNLIKYYQNIGFTPQEEISFFGHNYRRMELTTSNNTQCQH